MIKIISNSTTVLLSKWAVIENLETQVFPPVLIQTDDHDKDLTEVWFRRPLIRSFSRFLFVYVPEK